MEGDSLKQFFDEVSKGDLSLLNVILEQNGTLIARLQLVLQKYDSDEDIEALVEKQKLHGGSWTRFNILMTSFLKLCRDLNPWSLWESSDLIYTYYQDLTNCLLNDSFPVDNLVTLFQTTTEYIVPLSRQLDANYLALGTRQHQFLAHVSSIITKLFNSIKPRFEEPAVSFESLPRKQQILLYTANKLNNIYMRIDSSSSCANIFKNVKPKSAIQHFSQFPLREQVEYRYLLGRYYLLNHRVSNAFHQLNSAFGMLITTYRSKECPPAVQRNLQRILKYLLPAGILFGKMPSIQFCAQLSQNLASSYQQLATAVKTGNFASFHNWLNENEAVLRRQNLLILLLEKVPLLIYRNLVRRVVIDFCFPQTLNKISYEILEHALAMSLGNPPLSKPIYTAINVPEDIPNVLETLVNLTLLKANCFPLSKQCVFPKTQNINDIFPEVNRRLVALYPLNAEDAWLDD
ncbi:PCI domain-containing protein [Lachancea thermotolerans]